MRILTTLFCLILCGCINSLQNTTEVQKVSGSIRDIDWRGTFIILKTKEGKEFVIELPRDVAVRRSPEGRRADPKDIFLGENVSVTYENVGTRRIARSVILDSTDSGPENRPGGCPEGRPCR